MAASTSCTTFMNLRGGNSGEPRVRRSPSHELASCKKLDQVALWVLNGVATAFFASLERCSCMAIDTAENDDDDEAKDLPLIPRNGNFRQDERNAGGSSRRMTGKGKKRGGGGFVGEFTDGD